MKRFTFAISLSMVILLMFSALSVNALSFVSPYSTGDVDMSYSVTVKDATLIQKYVAKSENLTKGQIYIADTDSDTFVTVKDATAVQKHVAKLIKNFDEYKGFCDYMFPEAINPNIASGLATVDEEVTFYAKGSSFNKGDITYEFSINGEIMQARSTSDEFTYSFDAPGTYEVGVNIYDAFDNSSSHEILYTVAESRDDSKVFVKNFYYDSNLSFAYLYDTEFTANAGGGSGEYQYRFMLNDEVVQDYSDSKTFKTLDNIDYGTHIFTVTVRDVNTNEEASCSLTLNIQLIH